MYFVYDKNGRVMFYSEEHNDFDATLFQEIQLTVSDDDMAKIKNNKPFLIQDGAIRFIEI